MSAEPAPVRRSYHHTRVLWEGGVISDRARFCHEFGKNPDVEELERYNAEGHARECDHARLRRHESDEGHIWYTCKDCDLSDPNWSDKFKECPNCKWRTSYDRQPCPTCGGTHLIRHDPRPSGTGGREGER
jgi:hypothetical protein